MTPEATASPAGNQAIPVTEVIFQSEAVNSELADMRQAVDGNGELLSLHSQLRDEMLQVKLSEAEDEKMLAAQPSLENLRQMESNWRSLRERLSGLQVRLAPMVEARERNLPRLGQLQQTWQQTLDSVSLENPPPEVLQRIRSTQELILSTQMLMDQRQKSLLSLQARLADGTAKIEQSLTTLEATRQKVVVQLFYQDSPHLWQAQLLKSGVDTLWQTVKQSGQVQFSELTQYVQRRPENFLLHGLLIILLWALARWARGTVALWAQAEPTLERVAAVFQRPLAMAVLLSLGASRWLYPQVPPMGSAVLGAAALLPTILILRRLVESQLVPVLNVLGLFYLVDQFRLIATPVPALARILFVLQMWGGLAFCLLLIFRAPRLSGEQVVPRLVGLLRLGLRLGTVFFLAASLSNVLGYVNLSYLVGNAVLRCAYLALILYAAVRVIDGLLLLSLRMGPLSLLGSVRSHRLLLRKRLHSLVRWFACLFWILSFLEMLSQLSQVLQLLGEAWNWGIRLGSLHVTLGSLLTFVLIVWGSALASRALRFLLQEDVYPRMQLARGVPYAITTTSHYLLLVLGFVLAMAAAGIDMTRFTILAGAFSVGLGFGLQTIVNNFVSGLILLFERPVKIGDFVQIGDILGKVEQIGIRASVVRTRTSAEVIVPNSKLISDSVTNWTLSSRQRGLEIAVGVGCESDPLQVQKLLLEIARAHPEIAQDPPPSANLIEFGADTLNFELIAYTDVYESSQKTRSELMISILLRFNAEGITMPFPQRDVHLYSAPTPQPPADSV